jgi:hypothetical protein
MEEFELMASDLLGKVKDLVKEGNVRKIIIKDESGAIVAEFPLTIGAIGVILAPTLVAIGALAALMTKCTLVVVRDNEGQ